jgi:hypothetical protein
MKRIPQIAAVVGVAIPSAWMLIYHNNTMFSGWWLDAPNWVENVRLILWPTAIMLIADPHDKNVGLWVASAILNGVIYAFLGLLFNSIFRGKSGVSD